MISRIHGKLFGDKGYVSRSLFEQLFIDGIHLITKIRKNMKNSFMLTRDKILLWKRALIETVNDELKNICQIEHTRHRSQEGFIVNLISGLIAYHYLPKKPSLNLEVVDPSGHYQLDLMSNSHLLNIGEKLFKRLMAAGILPI